MFAIKTLQAALAKQASKYLPTVQSAAQKQGKRSKWWLLASQAAVPVVAPDKETSPAPGEKPSWMTSILETGASLTQRKSPLHHIHNHLCAFHFYADDMKKQVEAHHYCGHLNEDVQQCVLYDSNTANARAIGVEYIISEKLFKSLPESEKAMWHSHKHEVKSGLLIAPRLPWMAEHALMSSIAPTYGKVWGTWHVDEYGDFDDLPLGIPQLLMSPTKDGQIKESLIKSRDKRLGVNTTEARENRKDIPDPIVDPSADKWEKGTAVQLSARPVNLRDIKKQTQH
jgi:hypothetical protein